MKASEALIAWTPVYCEDSPAAGQIKIGRLLDNMAPDWTSGFKFTGGAAYVERRNLEGWQAIALTFIDFHSIVLRDGIYPQLAHKEFLKIDEYAERMSSDIEGAR